MISKYITVFMATCLICGSLPAETELKWEALKIGGGGQNLRLAFDQSDPERIYIAIDVCGIVISDDAGASWRNANPGLQGFANGNYPAGDIAVDPSNPNILYASWGREHQGNSGVIISEDRGKSWKWQSSQVCGFGEGKYPRKSGGGTGIVISKTGRILLIDNLHENGAGGIWISDDKGKNWKQTLKSKRVMTIRQSQADATTFYASAVNHPAGSGGFCISRDNGESWSELGLHGKDVLNFDFEKANPSQIYAICGYDGFMKSNDGGKSWTESNKGLPLAKDGKKGKYFEYYYRAIAADPHKDSHIVIVSDVMQSLYESFDGGENWALMKLDARTPDGWMLQGEHFAWHTNNIYFHPKNPGMMYLCDFFGTWRSTNGGKDWRINPYGQESSCMTEVLPDMKKPGRLYLGIWDHFMLIYQDDPKSPYTERCEGLYRKVNVNKHINSIVQFETEPEQMICIANSSHIFISRNRGQNWIESQNGLPENINFKISSIAIAQQAKRVFVCIDGKTDVDGGIYFSDDFGAKWTKCANEGLPELKLAGKWSSATDALAVSADSSTILLAADSKLYSSKDNGTSWTPLSGYSGKASIVCFTKDGDILLGSSDKGLQMSSDNGKNWTSLIAGGNAEIIKSNPSNPDEILCFSSKKQIDGRIIYSLLYSADKGKNWKELLNETLPVWRLRGLAFDPFQEDVIYANSYWCGSWKLKVK